MDNGAPRYLVALSVRAPPDAENRAGGDPAEVVLLGWAVVDAAQCQVSDIRHSFVRPHDLAKVSWDGAQEIGISRECLTAAPTLEQVLLRLETELCQLSCDDTKESFAFVTDGPEPLRQVLFPETLRKDVNLPASFNRYYDIRKLYKRLLNNNAELATLADVSAGLGVEASEEKACLQECDLLAKATVKVLAECKAKGLTRVLDDADVIKRQLEHGLCCKDEVIDSNTVVRARGLPWQSSDQDVARFFYGLNMAKGGVALCLSSAGRRNGEALVRFESAEQRDLALRRHRHFMGNRYIEIYRAPADDFIDVAAGTSNEAQEFLTRGAEVIVRMRGLPYDCTSQQILDFFNSGDAPVAVMEGEEGILFVNRFDGKASGDAFVIFATEADAALALGKHKESIGARYIELFRSTVAEVQQVINKTADPPSRAALDGGMAAAANLLNAIPTIGGLQSVMPQHLVISGQRRDCIRLRGLPYEAQVQHILDFLGDFASHIVFQGVHMVFNAQGHPSGEAFIQMDGEAAAIAAAADRHNKYMQIGKKQRYIEVFQCSADDMNLVLTGPAAPTMPAGMGPGTRLPISPGGLQPGMFSPPHGIHPQLLNPQIFGAGGIHNGALLPGINNRLPLIPGLIPGGGGAVVYWPYPSPPVSPQQSYLAAAAAAQHSQQQQQLALANGPTLVLVRGLPLNASTTDILAFFQGYPDVTAECVQMQRAPTGQPTGDALITFSSRAEAERAIVEKNHQALGHRPVDMYICTA